MQKDDVIHSHQEDAEEYKEDDAHDNPKRIKEKIDTC